MITQMKKYTFLVLASAYDRFLEQLREAGVVHVTLRAEGVAENEELQTALARADELQHILHQGAPDQLLKEVADVEQRIAATKREVERMRVWGNFSHDKLEALQAAGYTLRYYICPKSRFADEWGILIFEDKSTAYFVTVNNPLPEETGAIEQQLNTHCAAELEKDIEALNGLLVAAKARIEAWQLANTEKLKAELIEVKQQIDWQRVSLSSDTEAEGSLKLLEGFCPLDQCADLEAMLAGQDCYYEAEDPQPEDATPIKLRNNWFTRLFECLTGMYGWPNYGEFDPTPILGPFFLLFFALCIGDAGYGLLLILIGALIYKGKLKIDMFDGLGGIIMALGVGSAVVGYLMGGFFGINLYTAEWFPESAKCVMFNNLGVNGKIGEYDVMMVLSLVIGVFHICLAMTIKAISYTLRFGFKETLSVWGWLLLIVGSLITIILTMTTLISIDAAKIALIVIAAISAIGIFLLNKFGRNPLINIGSGLWDTYQMATGLLGDVLSYIRLYALGLAGGMLGAAFNQLGMQVLGENPNIGTWIGFILIVTFGHVLNLLMACLGAFVHPLRLSFVEYFKNAGYEGTGKLYTPFKK